MIHTVFALLAFLLFFLFTKALEPDWGSIGLGAIGLGLVYLYTLT